MTALANKRTTRPRKFSTISLAATASVTYYQGALVCFDTSTGLIAQGKASTTLIPIGTVAESITLGVGGGSVSVLLFREIIGMWFVNATAGDAVVAADVGGLAYILDDQTVANNDATNTLSVAGRVWALDSVKGVLVEPLQTAGGKGTESGLD